jgi:hypothetical protein
MKILSTPASAEVGSIRWGGDNSEERDLTQIRGKFQAFQGKEEQDQKTEKEILLASGRGIIRIIKEWINRKTIKWTIRRIIFELNESEFDPERDE